MMEFVLGTGQQKSIRDVLRIVEKQLRRTEGQPRKICLRNDRLEVQAERPEFEGEFESFNIRLRASDRRQAALKEFAAAHPDQCKLEIADNDGVATIIIPAPGEAYDETKTTETIDALSQMSPLPEVWRVRGDLYRFDRISIEMLFKAMVQYKASDVHLAPGVEPMFRIDGDTYHSELMGPLSAVQITALIKEIADDLSWQQFLDDKQTSFNFHQLGVGYSRVSAFCKSGAPHVTFRFLPEVIPSFEELNVPAASLIRMAELHHGLILITGMTGSGKTTTAAAFLDYINAHRAHHILSIENPIEYVHENKKSIVSQRMLGTDVATFYDAVTGALRHDPDVMFIGEMRDPDTIRAAINAAATGHLVVSTLHANTASEVVNRIVSFFDPVERDLVKLQLYDSLQCVICQRLVAKVGGGRVPALEMLFKDTKAIGDGIKSGNTDLIRVGMQQTVSHSFLFEQYLYDLYKKGKITLENARGECTDVSIFDQIHMGTYSVPRLDSIKHRVD
ncbi:MAG: PilT/PilU family type 4a pilus ATPase [Candidatus Hydrogenedentes bacterium]|nr:PilT/PilU family type 4a pilus ATPase [Candidatus Hydrogenedentota bacterium]